MGGEREESISEPGGLPGPDGAAMVRARRNPDSGGRIGWDDVADIFDEVNEDLRAERAQALLKRYGVLLLAAMLLVVAGAAAWQGWRWWRGKQDMAVATEVHGRHDAR